MGKRDGNKFARNARDCYGTIDPGCLVQPFVDRVMGLSYAEPCWGDGHLEAILNGIAVCKWRSDIEPQQAAIPARDAMDIGIIDLLGVEVIITNPPYVWGALKPILDHLPDLRPTWLLLPADYMHNLRMGPHMRECQIVVAIGRMFWLPNKIKGVSNMAWYKFDKRHAGPTEFVGR